MKSIVFKHVFYILFLFFAVMLLDDTSLVHHAILRDVSNNGCLEIKGAFL